MKLCGNSIMLNKRRELCLILPILASVIGSKDHHGKDLTSGAALTLLASQHLEAGRFVEATDAFKKAATLFPSFPLAWYNLGVVGSRSGDLALALEGYRRAAELDPTDADSLFRVAGILFRLGDAVGAWAEYRRAVVLALSRQPPRLQSENGVEAAAAAVAVRHWGGAYRLLSLLLRLRPGDTRAGVAAGDVLMAQNRHHEAARLLLRIAVGAGVVGGSNATAETAHGGAPARVAKVTQDELKVTCHLALALQRSAQWVTLHRLGLKSLIADVFHLRIGSGGGGGEWLESCVAVAHGLEVGLPPAWLLVLARAEAARAAHAAGASTAVTSGLLFPRPPPPGAAAAGGDRARRVLRVAYVSGSGFQSFTTTAWFVSGVLEAHDRESVDVGCYAWEGDDGSALRRRIRDISCSRFVEFKGLDVRAGAQRLNGDGVHVLVDLTGYTLGARAPFLALRPAPVQVHWHGYPGTLGADFVSHYIGDLVSTPPDLAGALSERLVLLPAPYMANSHPLHHAPCPTRRLRDLTALSPEEEAKRMVEAVHGDVLVNRRDVFGAAVGDDDVVLAVFSQAYKMDLDILGTWVRVLQVQPLAKLWILRHNPSTEPAIRAAAAYQGLGTLAHPADGGGGHHGGDPGQLVFTGLLERKGELAGKALGDLMLDTPLFGLHTTAVDGLWAGLPLLTAPGEALPARVAAALAIGGGSEATVARNLADYEDLARRLVGSRRALAAVQRRVRAARGVGCGLQSGAPPRADPRPAGRAAADGVGKTTSAAADIWRVGDFAGRLEVALRALWEVHAAAEARNPAAGTGAYSNLNVVISN